MHHLHHPFDDQSSDVLRHAGYGQAGAAAVTNPAA